MKSRAALAASLLLFAAAGAPAQGLVWDNYHTGPQGYDGLSALSSERNTVIPESWTADDALFGPSDFPEGLYIQQIRWIGMRDASVAYASADFIILDDTFNVVPGGQQLGVPYAFLRDSIAQDFPGLTTYEAAVSVNNIVLQPGRYYIAARLVNADGEGRNFIATTGEGVEFGGATNTMGAFQSPVFGFPEWVLVEQVPLVGATDFAYQIYGTPVPEPLSVALLAVGGVFLIRRRRGQRRA